MSRWRFVGAVILTIGISGCMLCDGYCARQRDRCQSYCNPQCFPAPVNHCAPGSGSYYPQPVQPQPNPCP